MTSPSKKYKNREPLSSIEIQEMINKADQIKNEYFRLRVKALVSLLKKFGKRKAEINSLRISDLKTENGFLYVTFTIRKKHKLGLFQNLKFLKKTDQTLLNKSYPELVTEWQSWKLTELGQHIKEEKRTKKVSVMDKYAKFIEEYLTFLAQNYLGLEYLFPSGHSVFGQSYIVKGERALSGRQLLNLIKPLNF